MKKYFKFPLALGCLLVVASCSDDYLEEQPSEFLTAEQIGEAASKNPDVVAGTMNGIYSLTVETGTGGTTGHDDFGHKGYDLFADMLTGDIALSVSTYGWYRASITEYQCTEDFTFLDNYQVWRYYYRIIRSANVVIDALGGNDAVPELEENRRIMGQAKAMRAHSYFYLTQYFSNTYNPSAEILPLYDDLQDQNGPKVATSVIYEFMEKDLNEAIELLDGFNRAGKNQINKAVAQGILAYVLASQGDRYQEVLELTADVIQNGGFALLNESEVLGGFNDLNTSSWMWGIDLTPDVGLGLISWWGQMDAFTYSYAWAGDAKAIDADLYDAIPADDIRKQQFNFNPGNYYHLLPINKFYDPGRTIAGQSVIETDYVYMRIEEMYLLHAEAAAYLGFEPQAISTMKTLLDLRLPDTSYLDGLTGQALKDEIYLQTRIELWGEGKTYLALKRNKKSVLRGPNHLSFVGVPIPYDDERMTFEIPQAEIQDNPFVNEQN